MDSMRIRGGGRLRGCVCVSGAKNACLPMFAAALLSDKKCVIKNVPDLSDVRFMGEIVANLGADISNPKPGVWEIQAKKISCRAPYDLVRKMRASICLLGPLAARLKRAEVSMPGGCVIGARPIDLHIKGLKALKCNVQIENGYLNVDAKKMRGGHIFLGGRFGSTVTGTANIVMASVLANGTSVIDNAACEPEIVDLCKMLVKMGAKIEGIGSPCLEITGVDELGGVEHTVLNDRIEAGTWIMAALATRSSLSVRGASKKDLAAVLDKLESAGALFEHRPRNEIFVDGEHSELKPVEAITMPHPGFPTDLQAQLTSLMTQVEGISIITERIYPERFMHVAELLRMGADIAREGPSAIVRGRTRLSGAPVMASDLRASAALMIAALCAEGDTFIQRIYHLDRGYENIDGKLASLGIDVERISELPRF